MEIKKEEKTIYELGLHETLFIEESTLPPAGNNGNEPVIKKYEVTRVPGGWVYSFEYPGFRTSPIVFVPFSNEFLVKEKINKTNKK